MRQPPVQGSTQSTCAAHRVCRLATTIDRAKRFRPQPAAEDRRMASQHNHDDPQHLVDARGSQGAQVGHHNKQQNKFIQTYIENLFIHAAPGVELPVTTTVFDPSLLSASTGISRRLLAAILERGIAQTQVATHNGMHIPQAADQLSSLTPVADRLLETDATPGTRELLLDYWMALTHVHRDAGLAQSSLVSGQRALAIYRTLESERARQLARRTLDTMASAASKANIPHVPEHYLSLAASLANNKGQAARVSLTAASVRAAAGDYAHSAHLIDEETVEAVAGAHSVSLAAAALIRRGVSRALAKGQLTAAAEHDIERAEDMLESALSDGPRLLQRLQLMEGKITLMSMRPSTLSCLWAERTLVDMVAVGALHGASSKRIAKMRLLVDGMSG